MKKSKFIKSEAENQLKVDEQIVNDVANADEFKDLNVSTEDVLDAVAAIDALADAVIEKADAEEKKLDPDELLDEVRDLIDETHEDEGELEEEEKLPEEFLNSSVRVMVSDDGTEIEVEDKPDEVYDSNVDDLECTVYDTCALPPVEVEEEGNASENTEDDLLVIGNSKTNNYKKGFVTLKSSANKKAWSTAFKKVKKMIGNAKMTAAHWVIVSALAKKEEEDDKKKKKIECALLKKIRSNKELMSKLLKSSEDFAPESGAASSENKPEETAGTENKVTETNIENPKSPEQIDSQSGNPTEEPNKQNEHEGDVVLPEGETVVLEVPLTNSTRKIAMKKVYSGKRRGFNAYRVLASNANLAKALDGHVVKSGKIAYVFKDTANGLLACAAQFVDSGKGKYTTIMSNGKVQIAKGENCKIFNNVEKFMNGQKQIASSRKPIKSSGRYMIVYKDEDTGHTWSYSHGDEAFWDEDSDDPSLFGTRYWSREEAEEDFEKAKEADWNQHELKIIESSRNNRPSIEEIRSRVERRMAGRKTIQSSKAEILKARREAIRSRMEARKTQIESSKQVDELRKMHEAEERQRLFQSSQSVMNEERIQIKQSVNRNQAAMEKLLNGMF